jgi:hypothetical protein
MKVVPVILLHLVDSLKALGFFLLNLRDAYEGGRSLNGCYLHINRFKSFGTSKTDMAKLAILNKEHEH